MATHEQLLNDAILAMADLHGSVTTDEREENWLIPPAALRIFVDAHARLLYERERVDPAPMEGHSADLSLPWLPEPPQNDEL